MANKFFIGTTDDKWEYDNAGGAGSNWEDAHGGGNPTTKPGSEAVADRAIIEANCVCSTDETAVTGEDIDIADNCTLEITTGGKLKFTDVDAVDGTGPPVLKFTGSGELELTGTISQTPAAGALLVQGVGWTGTLTIGADIVAGSWLQFDLDGTAWTLALATHSLIISCAGRLDLQHDSKSGIISGGGTYGLELTECAASLDNMQFTGCVKNLSIQYCDWRHLRIEGVSFKDVSAQFNEHIYVQYSPNIIFKDCYVEGGGSNFGDAIKVGYGGSVLWLGGALGYDSGGNADSVNRCADVSTGGELFCYDVALSYNTSLFNKIQTGGRATFLGEKTYSGGWAHDYSKSEIYVEGTSGAVEKMESSASGSVTVNLDDDNYHAPSEYNPWIVRGFVRVKGGNTPSISVDYDYNAAASGIQDGMTLVLDPGGAIYGTEATDTTDGDSGTLTATLAGALGGTDEFDLPFEIRCFKNADGAEVVLDNLVPANTGVYDQNMEFCPSIYGYRAVLAAAGGGGTIISHPRRPFTGREAIVHRRGSVVIDDRQVNVISRPRRIRLGDRLMVRPRTTIVQDGDTITSTVIKRPRRTM